MKTKTRAEAKDKEPKPRCQRCGNIMSDYKIGKLTRIKPGRFKVPTQVGSLDIDVCGSCAHSLKHLGYEQVEHHIPKA